MRSWVERLDPLTLATLRREPAAAGRPVLAGRDGRARVRRPARRPRALGAPAVAGARGARLAPAAGRAAAQLVRRARRRRARDEGLRRAGGASTPSTMSVLDPLTLLPVAPPLVAAGAEHRAAVERRRARHRGRDDAGLPDHARPRRGAARPRRRTGARATAPRRAAATAGIRCSPTTTSSGWTTGATRPTPRCSAPAATPAPVRLWWARHDDDAARCVEVSGLPYGTQSNPPGWDPVGRVVVGYDAGNAVLARLADDGRGPRAALAPRRLRARRPPDPAPGHARAGRPGLAGPPAPAAPCAASRGRCSARWRASRRRAGPPPARAAATGSSSSTSTPGAEKASCAVPSATQAYLFPAPGFGRDVYYQSLTTIARAQVR